MLDSTKEYYQAGKGVLLCQILVITGYFNSFYH